MARNDADPLSKGTEMKHSRVAAAIAAASLALIATATPASAAPPPPPVIEHWSDHVDVIEQEFNPNWCPDVPYDVRFVEDSHGTFRGITRGGTWYGASTWRYEGSWTNVETGKSFSYISQGQDKDRKATDNGDGTWTVEILIVGPTQYYDTDGAKLFKDVGRTVLTVVIDADGEWVDEPDNDSKGRFETVGRDFCADILEFTG
jgi:hypothetical protein